MTLCHLELTFKIRKKLSEFYVYQTLFLMPQTL